MKKETQDIQARLGRISMSFSSLEHEVVELITQIAFQDEWVLASAFIEKNSFSKNLDVLKSISRILIQSTDGKEIKEFVALANPLRVRRNSFIHGKWIINESTIKQKSVAVKDIRVKYKEEGLSREWRKGTTEMVSYSTLTQIEEDLELALRTIDKLTEKFKDYEYYT